MKSYEIYQPAEDSFLLSEVLSKELPALLKEKPNLKFLDMGTGSAIQAMSAVKAGVLVKNIVVADINPEAVKHAKKLKLKSKLSNLFSKLNKREKFDVIVFNPPYLPAHKFDTQPDTTGGKLGNEIIIKFLKQAKKFLKKHGKIFLLTSSHTPRFSFQPFNSRLLAEKKLFFEKLYVYELGL